MLRRPLTVRNEHDTAPPVAVVWLATALSTAVAAALCALSEHDVETTPGGASTSTETEKITDDAGTMDTLGVGVAAAEADRLSEEEAETDGDTEGDAVNDAATVPVTLGDTEPLAVKLGDDELEALAVAAAVPVTLDDTEPLAIRLAVIELETLIVARAVPVLLGDTEPLAVALVDTELKTLADAATVPVTLGDAELLAVKLGDTELETLADGVKDGGVLAALMNIANPFAVTPVSGCQASDAAVSAAEKRAPEHPDDVESEAFMTE